MVPLAAPFGAQDPEAFLRQVMNDPGVPLALRIEAAKALLPLPCPGADAPPAVRP
jgi:hypothetical protein